MCKQRKNRFFPWNEIQKFLVGLFLTSCAWGVFPESVGSPGIAEQTLDIYLLIGQSNMAGRGTVEEQDRVPNPSVLTFTKENKWISAVDPLHFDKSTAGVGPGRTFGVAMAARNSAVTIGLVPCAVGGTSILVWKPGAYDEKTDTHPYDDMMKRIKIARERGVLKGILWHQGSTDASTLGLDRGYQKELIELIQRLRKDMDTPQVPFIIGQMGQFEAKSWTGGRKNVDSAHRTVPYILPNVGFVSSDGLTDRGDKIHFDSASARLLGKRYADKMIELQDSIRKSPPSESLIKSTVQEYKLWPDSPPDALDIPDTETFQDQRLTNVNIPSLTVFIPPQEISNGTAVIICPGGAYRMLAIVKEGYDVARWLNSLGVTACVLKYRLGCSDGTGYHYPAQLNDVQRAMRLIRSRAKELKVNAEKVGLLGFSAGGHLASTAATHFNHKITWIPDAEDQVNCRPDFTILVYPHIALSDPATSAVYLDTLLGKNRSAEQIELLSNASQISNQTPPAFLVHAGDDAIVPVSHSVDYYLALSKAGVPAELHVFEKGGHGFGLGQSLPGGMNWPEQCEQWMNQMRLSGINN
jgi:acetyl esterase/lipase